MAATALQPSPVVQSAFIRPVLAPLFPRPGASNAYLHHLVPHRLEAKK